MPLIRTAAVLLALLVCVPASARPVSFARPAQDLLPADEAFQLLPVERRDGRLHVEWNVAPGYYLYRGRLHFELLTPSGVSVGAPELPVGEPYHDEHFGDVEIYRGIVSAELPLPDTVVGPIRLRLGYQGCADVGVCYPPQSREIEIEAAK